MRTSPRSRSTATAAAPNRTTATRIVERYRDDPCAFARDVLGLRLWSGQEEILEALRSERRVAVKAGQKTGKSRIGAAAAIWWPLFRERGFVRITSPTWDTTAKVLWREIRETIRTARYPLGPVPALDPLTGWHLPGMRGIEAIATNKPESAAGRSGANQLYIIDEASGYPEELWEPALGNLAGGGSILALSNPTKIAGTFFECFHSLRGLWRCITLDSRLNPNFTPGAPRIPGLADPESVELIRRQYGDDSPFFDVRVRGDFPRQGANVVISLAHVEEATRRWSSRGVLPDGLGRRLAIGVDVARFGDDESVITVRRGLHVLEQRGMRGYDGVELAGLIGETLARHRTAHDHGTMRPRLKIDGGGNGAGPLDVLRHRQGLDADVVEVQAGATAVDHARFARRRDELWWSIREWLEMGGTFAPGQAQLEAELVAPTYRFDSHGRIVIESKDDLRPRLKRSPDRADSLALALHEPPDHNLPGLVLGKRATATRAGF